MALERLYRAAYGADEFAQAGPPLTKHLQGRTVSVVYVNGRFLGRAVTGVERFAHAILSEIDDLAAQGSTAAEWRVLAPPGVVRPPWLKNVSFRTTGTLKGHLWEQIDLARASWNGALVNLCNSGPVTRGRQITVIHDASVYRHPGHFSKSYGVLHRTLGRLIGRRSRIATVSNFSRSELAEILGVPSQNIVLAPNAANHISAIEPDAGTLARIGVGDRPYILFVGSPAPNKNLRRAVAAFRALENTDVAFVIVGLAAKSFASADLGELPKNVIRTGRLTDEGVIALYRGAKALIFPSLYEGFGIPPLEAMAVGCPVLASDIPAVREVCGDGAIYFDPYDVPAMTEAMRLAALGLLPPDMTEIGCARVANYSWRASAETIVGCAEDLSREQSRTN